MVQLEAMRSKLFYIKQIASGPVMVLMLGMLFMVFK